MYITACYLLLLLNVMIRQLILYYMYLMSNSLVLTEKTYILSS